MRRLVTVRRVLVLGLLVVGLGSLAPYGFGLRTAQILHGLVQVADYVFDVPLVMSRYTRGWFGATAETALVLSPATLAVLEPYLPKTLLPTTPAEGVTLTHAIRHGPFPLGPRADGVHWLRPVQTLLTSTWHTQAPQRAPLLRVETTVFLLGAGHGQITMPAFTTPDDAHAVPRLLWRGLQGEVRVDAHGRHVTATVQAPGMTWAGAARQVAFTTFTGRTTVTSTRQQPQRTDTQLTMASVALTPTDTPGNAWAVTGLALHGTSAVQQRTAQGTLDLRLDAVRLAETSYGPGSVVGTVDRLFLPAVRNLWSEIYRLRQDEPDWATLWIRLVRSEELARLLGPVLPSSPELALSQVQLHTPDGPIHATLRVRVDGTRLLPPGYLVQLLQTIDAQASIAAPVAWVKALAITQARRAIRARSQLTAFLPDSALDAVAGPLVERYLRQYEAAGYLVRDGAMYTSQARYTRGQLWVQGRPVNLAQQDE